MSLPNQKTHAIQPQNHRFPVRRNVRQKKHSDDEHAQRAGNVFAPCFAGAPAPKTAEITVAAGQNPIPEASVELRINREKGIPQRAPPRERPNSRGRHNPKARKTVQRQPRRMKNPRQQPDQKGLSPKPLPVPQSRPLPENAARTFLQPGQTVVANPTCLNSSHDRRGCERSGKRESVPGSAGPDAAMFVELTVTKCRRCRGK